MFTFLEIQLKKKNVTKKELSDYLGISYDTVIKKFNGTSDWWRDECEKIRDKYFPEFSLDELFKKD